MEQRDNDMALLGRYMEVRGYKLHLSIREGGGTWSASVGGGRYSAPTANEAIHELAVAIAAKLRRATDAATKTLVEEVTQNQAIIGDWKESVL